MKDISYHCKLHIFILIAYLLIPFVIYDFLYFLFGLVGAGLFIIFILAKIFISVFFAYIWTFKHANKFYKDRILCKSHYIMVCMLIIDVLLVLFGYDYTDEIVLLSFSPSFAYFPFYAMYLLKILIDKMYKIKY